MNLWNTMYRIGISLSLIIVAMLLTACAGREVSACAEAYETATGKVLQATGSEELLEISYALHIELAKIGDDDADEARRVVKARQEFETAVRNREIEFYSNKHKKK